MPAKDRYHDAVKRALLKAGWRIEREQITFIIEDRHVQMDLKISDPRFPERAPAYVEIKSFLSRSAIDDLAVAIGKYMMYRVILDELELNAATLYLAVPVEAYHGVLKERIGMLVRQRIGLVLLVVDVVQEEIREWNP